MITPDDYSLRGWKVVPAFAPALPAGLIEAMSAHPESPGESSWGTRNILYSFVLSMRPKTVLEIGSHIGSGAIAIGAALRQNEFGVCYSLEPADHYFAILCDFVQRAALADFIRPLQMYSTDPGLERAIGDRPDIIFIDANHAYSHALKDIELSCEILNNNGIIFLDDVGPIMSQELCTEGRGGVRQALLDFTRSRLDLQLTLFEPPFWLNPCGLGMICKQNVRPSPVDSRPTWLSNIKSLWRQV